MQQTITYENIFMISVDLLEEITVGKLKLQIIIPQHMLALQIPLTASQIRSKLFNSKGFSRALPAGPLDWIPQFCEIIVGRTRFKITVIPSFFSQITVVLSTFFMKLRIFVSVTWLNHRIPRKTFNYHLTAKKLVKYRIP